MDALATANARKLIEKYSIKYPQQYSVEQILNAEGLILEEKPLDGCAGSIVFSEKIGIVTVDTKIKEGAQKRFVTAHELGHFENEKAKIKFCSYEDIMSIKKNIKDEMNANDFSAEFLMHEPWFLEYVKGETRQSGARQAVNVKLLQNVANYFNVSLSAAAIRYAQLGNYPTVIIMSKNGKVAWSAINKYFTFKWIPNGYKVNPNSYAYDFYGGKEIPSEPEKVLADSWFLEDRSYRKDFFLNEFNIPMKNYNAVLTVVWERE